MMQSLGCKQEGTIREVVIYNGKFHSRLLFGLTAIEHRHQLNE